MSAPAIYLSNSTDFPSGLKLDPRTEVRFQTSDDPEAYLDFYMPTTRDRGWIQVTAAPFRSPLLYQHNSGLYLRSSAWKAFQP